MKSEEGWYATGAGLGGETQVRLRDPPLGMGELGMAGRERESGSSGACRGQRGGGGDRCQDSLGPEPKLALGWGL